MSLFGLAESQLLELVWVMAIFSILAMSLNLVMGQAGLFQLGHVGFFALGGVAAFLGTHVDYLGLDLFLGLLLGAAFAVVAALLVALPTLRLRGDYFAIATLGFAAIVQVSLDVYFVQGVYGIPPLNPFGLEVTAMERWFEDRAPAALSRVTWRHLELVFVLAVAAATYVLLQRLGRAPFGRTLRAIREDEQAAQALGKNVLAFRLKAFLLSAVLASVAGALYVHHLRVFNPGDYGFSFTITLLLMVILGGLGSNQGAVLGAVLVTIVNEVAKDVAGRAEGVDVAALNIMLFAALLVGLMIMRPQGIMGDRDVRLIAMLRRRPPGRKPPDNTDEDPARAARAHQEVEP